MPKDLELYKAKVMDRDLKKKSRQEDVHLARKGIKNNMEGKLRSFFNDKSSYEEDTDNKVISIFLSYIF